jgi:hypothetical protein
MYKERLLRQGLSPEEQQELQTEVTMTNAATYIHFSQIKNAVGELYGNKQGEDPFKFDYWPGDGKGCTIKSDKAQVGDGKSFKNGSGIGLWFWFPLELTFYLMPMEDVAVTGIDFGGLEPGSWATVTVTAWRAPGLGAGNGAGGDGGMLTAKVRFNIPGITDQTKEAHLPRGGEQQVGFSFKTPAKGILGMAAEINPETNGKRGFEEVTYANNKLAATAAVGSFADIPPWALTQKLSFDLSSSATLVKEGGQWASNASGGLDIADVSSPAIYNGFKVGNNPPAHEWPPSVHRSPNITATLDRADFGDDPKGRRFAPNHAPLSEKGVAKGSGTIEAAYKWTVATRDPGPPPTTDRETFYGSKTAGFAPIDDERAYTFGVYNGEEKLPPPKRLANGVFDKTSARQPMVVLDNGKNRQYQYKLAWEGTHYPFGPGHGFDVARYMCHLDEGGSEYGWEPVQGQYARTFVGQSTGAVTWQTAETMEHLYKPDRDAAAARKSGKGNYTHAVFATDKLLQSYAYPIKSGYYFNPAGAYRCKVETVQYKDAPGPTDEHKKLVQAVIGAFSYESGLVYVNSGQSYGGLGAITAGGRETAGRARGLLKIAPGHHGLAPLSITATLLETGLAQGSHIHPLIRGVLEGYGESGTDGSYEKYKYREYTDQVIYEVEETTSIDFVISVPSGQKMYTHVNMKNGGYAILAKVGKIEFDFGGYLNLEGAGGYEGGTVLTMEAFNLDGIKVTVSGSMYDDRQ